MIRHACLMIFAAHLFFWVGPAAADTTHDCSRYQLKLDKKTGKNFCVGGTKKSKKGSSTSNRVTDRARSVQKNRVRENIQQQNDRARAQMRLNDQIKKQPARGLRGLGAKVRSRTVQRCLKGYSEGYYGKACGTYRP